MAPAPYKNGNGSSANNIVSYFAIGVSVVVAFWSVANPKDDVKQIKIELADKAKSDKAELQAEIVSIAKEMNRYLPAKEAEAYREETKGRIERSIADIQRLYDMSRAPSAAISTLADSIKQREDRMDQDIKVTRDSLTGYVRREDANKDLAALNERISGLRETTTAAFDRSDKGVAEIRLAVSGASTIGDQLKAMQRQIDALQDFLRSHKSPP